MSIATAHGALAYQRTSVQSAPPLELVVLLYDGALRHLASAREAIVHDDRLRRREGFSRTLAILAELQNTLNLTDGGDVARSLDALYTYVIDRIVYANAKSDARAIEECERLVRSLRDAWAQVAASGPRGH